jgi:PTS system glucitol/sorbitol-specific IIA component
MGTYYRSSVTRLGDEAPAFVTGGVMILFREPVPEELAEVSVIHAPIEDSALPIQRGDELAISDSRVTVTEVGERADANLRELGHLVVYLNPDSETDCLPGAMHAKGELKMPELGDLIELRRVQPSA